MCSAHSQSFKLTSNLPMHTNNAASYSLYLSSPYWASVSEAVKRRANFRCQLCNSAQDLQAHHRTYEHKGREMEFLEDLTCLCCHCHGLFHSARPIGMAAAARINQALVLITPENCKRLRSMKEAYHWMIKMGIDPTKKGWAKRAIGHSAPSHFLQP